MSTGLYVRYYVYSQMSKGTRRSPTFPHLNRSAVIQCKLAYMYVTTCTHKCFRVQDVVLPSLI